MSIRLALSRFAIAALAPPIAFFAASSPDAREIMRRSTEARERNSELARGYVFSQRAEDREFDASGKVKSVESKTFETLIVEGRPARQLVARNNRPLSAGEQKKERERLNKIAEERRKETPREKTKRLAAAQEEKIFNREILDAFDVRIVGEEQIGGREAWIVEGTPRPGYQPKEMKAQILPHIKGKLWVDKRDYGWAKVDAEVVDNISFGLVLARMEKGSRLYFEQTRMDEGVWLPRVNRVQASARIGLIKKVRIDQETTFRNYRKVEEPGKP